MFRWSKIKPFIIVFLVWRAMLQIVAWIASRVIPYAPTFPYSEWLHQLAPWWLARWSGFDGVHYLTIAEKGYGFAAHTEAFFPLFPLVINMFNVLFRNGVVSSLLIAHIFALISIVLFAKIVEQEIGKKAVGLGLAVLLLFPTSYALVSSYTESMFLACTLGSWYAARAKRWWIAGLLAAGASATRVVGIFFVVALLLEAFLQVYKPAFRKSLKIFIKHLPWKEWLGCALGALGLLSYMMFLQLKQGDAIAFFHVQDEFAGNRQENLILFPQVTYRYVRMLTTSTLNPTLYYSIFQEFFITVFVGALLIGMTVYSWKKRKLAGISWPLLTYAWASFLLPPLTGTFQSMPRYVYVIFPVLLFIVEVLRRKPRLRVLYLCCFTILLIVNIAFFIQGVWVA